MLTEPVVTIALSEYESLKRKANSIEGYLELDFEDGYGNTLYRMKFTAKDPIGNEQLNDLMESVEKLVVPQIEAAFNDLKKRAEAIKTKKVSNFFYMLFCSSKTK